MAKRIKKNSEIVSDEVIFRWRVSNFSVESLREGVIMSPPFKCLSTDYHFQISHTSDLQVQLQLVQSDSEDPPRISRCTIGFYYSDPAKWHAEMFRAPVKSTDIFYAISSDTLEKDCISNKVLRVACIIEVPTIKHSRGAEPVTQTVGMTKHIEKNSEIVSDEVNFTWRVSNFSVENLLEGVTISPPFKCSSTDFHLSISHASDQQIQLRLVQSDSEDPPRISMCSLGFYYSNSSKGQCEKFSAPVKSTGIFYAISSATLKKDFISNEVLRVACAITASNLKHALDVPQMRQTAACEKKKSLQQSFSTLAKSIESIMHDSRFSDITLKVGENTFQAHKAILASRSRVFDGMFESGMKESQEGVVQMEDMESSTMKEMLQYIYAGKIEELSMDRAMDLYIAADRYDLPELVGWCKDFIVKHISADDVCNVSVRNCLKLQKVLLAALQDNSKVPGLAKFGR